MSNTSDLPLVNEPLFQKHDLDAIDDNEHLQLALDNVFKILQKINFND